MLLLLLYGDGSDPVIPEPPITPDGIGSTRRVLSTFAESVDREDDDMFVIRIL